MMNGWKSCKVKDLRLDLIDGDRGKQYPKKTEFLNDGYCLFLNTSNVRPDGFDFNSTSFITKEKDELLRKGKLSRQDIILTTRGTIGNVAIYNDNVPFENIRINSGMLIIRSNKEDFDNKYLFQYFKSSLFQEQVKQFQYGAAQPQLPIGTLNHIKIVVPPLKTQRKIASILSAYDDLIENNLKRIKLLEEQAQQTYEEWFVRMKFPGYETAVFDEVSGLPVGWELKKMVEVSKINSKSLKKDFKGELKYIDIASVSIGKIDSTTTYDFSKAPGRAKRIVQHGDIIWSCVRPNRKSHSVIWNPEDNLIASTGFCVISPKSLPTSYLLKYVTTNSFVAYLTNMAGGAAYPAVKAIDFKDAVVVVPIKDLLNKFDNKFRSVLDISSNLQNQNQLLKEARDILLPRLITGMIDPSASSGQVVESLEIDGRLGPDSYREVAEGKSEYKINQKQN